MAGNGDYTLAALKRFFGFDSFRPGQEVNCAPEVGRGLLRVPD